MDLHERRRAAAERLAGLAAVDRAALRAWLDPRRVPAWVAGILLVAVPSQALAIWRVFGDLPAGTRPPMRDSIIFEYIGWYLTRGGRLYIDAWEIKPPLPFELVAVVSLVAGGDPVLAHWLNVLLTSAAAVGTALVVGLLVSDLTGSDVAAFAAGVSLYALPAYHWRAAFGFKVKYFVPLFVLLAVYFARRDRPGTAGLAAGAAVGFWQLAVVAPALAAGVAYQRGGRPAVVRVVAGTAGLLAVGLLPVVYWGAFEAMVTETVLVPLLAVERAPPSDHVRLAVRLFGGSLPVALLGAIGVAAVARWQPRTTWWLAAGTAWFGLQVLVLDLDAAPDLFALMAFLAAGIGTLLGFEGGSQRPAAVLVAVIAVVSVVTMGGFGLAGAAVVQPGPVAYDPGLEPTPPYSGEERAYLYWNRVPPETCRVFYGPTQHQLVQRTGQSAVQGTCGDARPVLDALLARGSGG